jgi:hypothetical protein
MDARAVGLGLVAGRGCGACNVCCVVPKIDEPALQKLPGCRCPNAAGDGSCAIYEQRPRTCREFYCGWRLADWIDERLRPDQSGIFIRLTGDPSLVSGKYPFAMTVTVLGPDCFGTAGFVETILTAINAEIATYLIVPGPPGYTSLRIPLNRLLCAAAARNEKPAILSSLKELHARTQPHMSETRPVILRTFPAG